MKSVSASKVSHSSSTTPERSTTWALGMVLAAIRAMVRMMDTSCAMVSRTPGRCTLTATSSPVVSFARCTCARLADPSGVASIWSKISPAGRPYSSSSTCRTVPYGMGSASARSLASSSQNDWGRISERMDRICPTFTKVGPSASNMSRILTGVRPCTMSNWLTICAICASLFSLPRRVRW